MLPTKHTTAALALAAVFLCCSIRSAQAQENAQLQIPPSLVECYNTSFFMNRDNRLPSNIDTLITLIEKVENSYGFNQDIRTLAVSLLHRFRQDGIQRAPGVVASPGVIPYSPIGFQFPKFRILLSRLIPGNALQFPNSSLSREERCSMHFMLSSSFDTRVRGDESQVCNQLSQYRTQRLRRSLENRERSNFLGDVELLENWQKESPQSGRQMRPNIKPFEFDAAWTESDYSYTGTNQNDISQCPVENGVVRTPWGTISAGTLIAGIAAGLQPQNVQLRTLLAFSRRPGGPNMEQVATVNVDNRWAATLAGDLAEVALVQVPVSSTESATVGSNGAWNNTVLPRWYFLSQRQNMEMTDAEIRGGLDGLIIAMNIANWRTQAPSMKLSQLLRMYYSLQGVLGSGIMACNRQANFVNVAPSTTMIAQTTAFAQVLDREMQLRVTLTPSAIAQFSTSASQALISYIPQYMTDVSCSVSNAIPQDISQSVTAMTNIYVYLDTSWQYNNVVNYVIYVLQGLNINPYASSVTMLAANDASVMVNTTNYITDVYENWNVTTHSMFGPGFNLPVVLRSLQNQTQNLLNAEKTNASLSGRSLVALLVPNMAGVGGADASYSTTQLQYMYEQIPDLRIIYYTGGTVNRFNSYVRNPAEDLFPLSLGSTFSASAGPVVMRIKKIPRRIINPNCGANWYTTTWGTNSIAQYVTPGTVNFYRLMPNYFFGSTSGRYLNLQTQSSLTFTVCSSRTIETPTQNSSSYNPNQNSGQNQNSDQNQNCVQLSGSSAFDYDISNACNGNPTIHQCAPLYISVQAPPNTNGNTPTVSCNDNACQTPTQSKFTISAVNLGCFSGAASLIASFATIILAYLSLRLFQ